MKTSTVIPISIVIGGIIVAGALYAAMPKSTGKNANAALIRPVTTADHIFGNPAAKVMLVEYSDFDCQYCKAFDATLHELIANEGVTGNIAWVFREFPLTEIHPNALALAEAAECAAKAGGNEAFWNFEEALFAAQPADPGKLGPIAAKAGVPPATFASCYADAKSLMPNVMADRQNALDMGAVGTPFSVIVAPGKAPIVIDGAYSYDALKSLVDQALSQ